MWSIQNQLGFDQPKNCKTTQVVLGIENRELDS
jgi:hypothetical protein